MKTTPGTAGYEKHIDRFVTATEQIPFEVLHRAFLPFLPVAPAQVLDLGAGIGRDAYELCQRGFEVTAVEPLITFRQLGQERYRTSSLIWLDDALPELSTLDTYQDHFDFILISGVWHHLDQTEQEQALIRITALLKVGGKIALSLRHGPAGAGTHAFPISTTDLIRQATIQGLMVRLHLSGQASLLPNKSAVLWTRLVLEKGN